MTPLRIVVVDDDHESADTLSMLLQLEGHAPEWPMMRMTPCGWRAPTGRT